MVPKISGQDVCCVQKDPRRRSKVVQFKNRTQVPYDQASFDIYKSQKSKATMTSAIMVAGSLAVTIGYFIISAIGAKNISRMV